MKKRKSKRLNVSTHLGEQATPERVWHAGPDGIRVEQVSKADPRKRQKIISQHPIDRHLQRGEITKRHWEAAERLTSLHRRAGLAARTGSDWTREIVDGGSAGMEPGEASAEYFGALRAIGRDLASIAQWVVIEGSTPGEWAQRNGHAVRGGVVALRLCLDGLGDFFGMPRG